MQTTALHLHVCLHLTWTILIITPPVPAYKGKKMSGRPIHRHLFFTILLFITSKEIHQNSYAKRKTTWSYIKMSKADSTLSLYMSFFPFHWSKYRHRKKLQIQQSWTQQRKWDNPYFQKVLFRTFLTDPGFVHFLFQ